MFTHLHSFKYTILFSLVIFFLNIKVNAQCIADIESIPTTLTSCEAFGVQFRDKSTGIIASRTWNFGDGSATVGSQNPFHVYTTLGTNTVYTAALNIRCTNNATSTKTFSVTVYAKPTVSFTLSSTEICALGDTLPIINNSSSGTGYSYMWDFGDNRTSTDFSPKHRFLTAGKYGVSLSVTTPQGCRQTKIDSIRVKPSPNPDFTVSNYDGCLPANIQFQNTTNDPSNEVVSWLWDFGDSTNSTAKNPGSKLFTRQGTFNLSLTATSSNGCVNTTALPIITSNRPTKPLITAPANICPRKDTIVSAYSSTPGVNYTWSIQNGNIKGSPNGSVVTVNWNKTGLNSIKVTITNGSCSAEEESFVNIYKTEKIIVDPYKEEYTFCSLLTKNVNTYQMQTQPFYYSLYSKDLVSYIHYSKVYTEYQPINAIEKYPSDVAPGEQGFYRESDGYVHFHIYPMPYIVANVKLLDISISALGVQTIPSSQIILPSVINKYFSPGAIIIKINERYSKAFYDEYHVGEDINGCTVYSDTLRFRYFTTPETTLSGTNIVASDNCFGNPVTFTGVSELPNIKYSFFYNNQLMQSGRDSVWVLPTINSSRNQVYIKSENQLCEDNSFIYSFTGIPLPERPQLNCGRSRTDYVSFKWGTVSGVSSFELSTNGGVDFFAPPLGGISYSYSITGLTAGEEKSLVVKANFTNTVCGAFTLSNEQSCIALDCEEIEASLAFSQSQYCHGETVTGVANVSLHQNTNNFKYIWNSVSTTTGNTYSYGMENTRYKDSLVLGVVYGGNDPACRPYRVRAKPNISNPLSITNVDIDVLSKASTMLENSGGCLEDRVRVRFDPDYFGRYNVYTLTGLNGVKGGLLLTSTSANFFINYSSFSGPRQLYVEAVDENNCSEGKIINLPCSNINLSMTESNCDGIDPAITLSGDNFDLFNVYVNDSSIYNGPPGKINLPKDISYYLVKIRAYDLETKDSIETNYLQFNNKIPAEFDYKITNFDNKCGLLDATVEYFPKLEKYQYFLEEQKDKNGKIKGPPSEIFFLDYGKDGIKNSQKVGPYQFEIRLEEVFGTECPVTKTFSLDDKYIHVAYKSLPGSDSVSCGKPITIYPIINDKLRFETFTDSYRATYYQNSENYQYYKFRWNTGDTTTSLTLPYDSLKRFNAYHLTLTRRADNCERTDSVLNRMNNMKRMREEFRQLCIDEEERYFVSHYSTQAPNIMTHKWSQEPWIGADMYKYDTLQVPLLLGRYGVTDTVCFYQTNAGYYVNKTIPWGADSLVFRLVNPDTTTQDINFTNSRMNFYRTTHAIPKQMCVIKCGKTPIVPNVITPNGDGLNDFWTLKEFNEKVKVKIFSRWGELVFEDNDYKNTWAGVGKNGQDLPSGPYFYIVQPETGYSYYNESTKSFSCEPVSSYQELKGTILIEK